MAETDLQDVHKRVLLQPILTLRLRPWWGRLLRVPALYRVYRQKGLYRTDAWRLAWMVMRHPHRLAKLQQRWGGHPLRRSRA